MRNTKKTSDELQHERILRITKLLENGKAGLNREGRIVYLRKYTRAAKISLSTLQAARILMTAEQMHIRR